MRKYYGSNNSILQEEKYLYLLLFAPGHTYKFNEPIKGSAWLHRHVHVLSKVIPEISFEFEKHDFAVLYPKDKNMTVKEFTFQMSDHFPLRIQLDVWFDDVELKKIAKGKT